VRKAENAAICIRLGNHAWLGDPQLSQSGFCTLLRVAMGGVRSAVCRRIFATAMFAVNLKQVFRSHECFEGAITNAPSWPAANCAVFGSSACGVYGELDKVATVGPDQMAIRTSPTMLALEPLRTTERLLNSRRRLSVAQRERRPALYVQHHTSSASRVRCASLA